MSEIGSKKIEQCAIDKVNSIIGQIKSADSNLTKNDKNISWDGTIDFYDGNIDKKKNYEFSVDVQVKGRTTHTKTLNDKTTFDISVVDMENFQKRDGTLFLLVKFKSDLEEYKIYYIDLLPYNIARELASAKKSGVDKIKIKMKELKDGSQLENICRNFQINKSIQKRMNKDSFLVDYEIVNPSTVAKFTFWEKDVPNFNLDNLIGKYHFFYNMDENNNPIGVSYGIISDMSKELEMEVYTKDKLVLYDRLIYTKTMNGHILKFGKAFTINDDSKQVNIKICGTLNERIKQLKFINQSVKDKSFFVGNGEYLLDVEENNQFIDLEKMYIYLRTSLNKHGITKDLDLDLWKNREIEELANWLDAIDNGKEIQLNSDVNMLGSKTINDIRLSVIVTKKGNGLFSVESIWNSGDYDRYNFKHIDINGKTKQIINNNLFLNLNTESYLADDINYEEMKKAISNITFTEDECLLLNFQVLDILKAYDISKDNKLLDYAEHLTSLLLKNDIKGYDIYYINYCQILKRKGAITSKEIGKLIKIRDNTDKIEIKLCCNALFDNNNEVNLLLKNLDESTMNILKDYPISIYFK